jgi:hypothetical protein
MRFSKGSLDEDRKKESAKVPVEPGTNLRKTSLAGVEGQRPPKSGCNTGGEGGQGGKGKAHVGRKADCTGARPRPAANCDETGFPRDEPPRKTYPPFRKVSAQTPPRLEPIGETGEHVPIPRIHNLRLNVY